jgi:hypothetical protein
MSVCAKFKIIAQCKKRPPHKAKVQFLTPCAIGQNGAYATSGDAGAGGRRCAASLKPSRVSRAGQLRTWWRRRSTSCSPLEDVLEAAKELFDSMSDGQCAACVQILRQQPGQDIKDASIETIKRDKGSAAMRGVTGNQHQIGKNDILSRIFVNKEDHVLENNIKQLMEYGRITTTSRHAGESYNAILVVPIPSLNRNIDYPLHVLSIDSKPLAAGRDLAEWG